MSDTLNDMEQGLTCGCSNIVARTPTCRPGGPGFDFKSGWNWAGDLGFHFKSGWNRSGGLGSDCKSEWNWPQKWLQPPGQCRLNWVGAPRRMSYEDEGEGGQHDLDHITLRLLISAGTISIYCHGPGLTTTNSLRTS